MIILKKNSFVEGTIIATVAIIIIKILGMLYVIPFYATVGITGGALYAYAYNIYVIFLDMSTAGIPIAMSKITSEYNALGMMDAKRRAFKIGKKIISYLSIGFFIILFIFARPIAGLLVGSLDGGNTIADVAFVFRAISFAILIVPRLGVLRGYLQGHKFISPPSISQIIEQVVRIIVILLGSYLALNIFSTSVTSAISIAVFGAFLGAGASILYIMWRINKSKKELNLDVVEKKDDVTDKEIRKKIIKYAVPFIIVGLHASVYNFTNMVLILRMLNFLGFSTQNVEFITSAITTYAPKLNMIVISIAIGMGVNLIPAISAAFNLNNWKEVSAKLNKALQIIIIVALPMTILISLLAEPIWTIFYGWNSYGTAVMTLNIFVALFMSLFLITVNTLQSLNKFKIVYLSVILGFALNLILNVPLMLLFDYIGVYAFYGAIVSTIIGYSTSIYIALRAIKKDHEVSYNDTTKILGKMILPIIITVIVVLFIKIMFPYNEYSRVAAILYTGVVGLIGALVYLVAAYKSNIFSQVFGKELINKLIKKLAFWQAS